MLQNPLSLQLRFSMLHALSGVSLHITKVSSRSSYGKVPGHMEQEERSLRKFFVRSRSSGPVEAVTGVLRHRENDGGFVSKREHNFLGEGSGMGLRPSKKLVMRAQGKTCVLIELGRK